MGSASVAERTPLVPRGVQRSRPGPPTGAAHAGPRSTASSRIRPQTGPAGATGGRVPALVSAASSAGSVVISSCSARQASAWKATRCTPGGQQGWPRSADSRNARSPVGQPERGDDRVDGLGGLAQQDLGGGVGDHRPAQIGAQHVGGVLGGDGEPGPVLAPGLGRAQQELGAGGLLQQQPRLVDHDQPRPPVGGVGDPVQIASRTSRVADRAQLLGQLPQRPHHQVRVAGGWWSGRRTARRRRRR